MYTGGTRISNDNKYIIYINGTAVEVSKEIHDFLAKSDRQMKYAEQDRKQERITIDSENERVSVKPSMEDSLDRLTELGVEFPDRREDLLFLSSKIVTISPKKIKPYVSAKG